MDTRTWETYDADVSVNGRDAVVGAWFQKFAGDDLLHGEDHAIFTSDPDGCAAVLHRLHRILDLEVSAVGGENGVGKIIAGAY